MSGPLYSTGPLVARKGDVPAWHVFGECWLVTTPEGYIIATTGPAEKHDDGPRNEADARLYAAAPDLLDACRDALDESVNASTYPDGPNLPGDTRRKLAAAIAKAEGR